MEPELKASSGSSVIPPRTRVLASQLLVGMQSPAKRRLQSSPSPSAVCGGKSPRLGIRVHSPPPSLPLRCPGKAGCSTSPSGGNGPRPGLRRCLPRLADQPARFPHPSPVQPSGRVPLPSVHGHRADGNPVFWLWVHCPQCPQAALVQGSVGLPRAAPACKGCAACPAPGGEVLRPLYLPVFLLCRGRAFLYPRAAQGVCRACAGSVLGARGMLGRAEMGISWV